ncbi:MAG: ABC transporter substrate-binding protein [Chloroflexota bacterium]|nr:ABC transporter substrate-binding protein [Chloroflexota bacterium]MDQ2741529.1 ABC transporter substrate-binding protein [Chloroflexota bacterium]
MSDTRAPLIPDGGLSRREFLRLTGVAVGATALGGIPELAETVKAAPAEAKRGGALRLGNTADVISFEPYAVSDNVSIWTMLLMYDQLTRPTTNGLSIEPSLAQSWDISNGGKTYTFHLRKGIKFHDGTPLTAADVKFCVERAAFAKNTQWAFILASLKGMEVMDSHTVRAHLNKPHAPFLSDMALFATSVYPARLFHHMGSKLWQHPIGTGPFKFQSWKRGSEIILARNPHFWRTTRQPYVDTFHNMVVGDANTRVLQVQSGELDIALFVPPAQAKAMQGNPNVAIHLDNFMDSHFAPIDVTKALFKDKRVRQALNYAIDKETIVKKVLFGYAVPSGQALPAMWGADPSIKAYPYDPNKARALLKAAGHSHGMSFKLLVDAAQESDKEIATLMQEQLAKVGVKTQIEVLEEATEIQVSESKKYDVNIGYMTSDIIDPDELVSFAMAGNGGTDSIWSYYNNPRVNQLAAQAAGEPSRTKRLHLYYEIDRIHHDDAPMIFLYRLPSITMTTSKVAGFKVLPTGNYRLEEAWLK